MKSKSFVGAVTAAALVASSAFAADIAPARAPLPAGKAAGTHQAALLGVWAPIFIAASVALFVGLAASGAFQDDSATPTTQGFQGNNH